MTEPLKQSDQYILIDKDKIIVDEMKYIVEADFVVICDEDEADTAELKAAAAVILRNYAVPE